MRISEIRNTQQFQDLCQSLLVAEDENTQIVRDSSGDEGIDAYVPSTRTLYAVYCPEVSPTPKPYYQRKIRSDLKKAVNLRDNLGYPIEHWVFLTPAPVEEKLYRYLLKNAKASGFITGSNQSEIYLVNLLTKHPHLRSQFPELIIPDIESSIKDVSEGIANLSSQIGGSAKGGTVNDKLDQILESVGVCREVESKPNQFQKTHQLRAAVADFVGREEEINVLISGLNGGGRVGISGVNGMGGIGKTELALLTANQIKEEFPDGQIFIDMEGTSETPLDPAKAIATCIRAFVGLDAKLSDDLNELRGFYFSVLAGKRVLLVLDNAIDRDQVSPLSPPEGSALLVTSRSRIVLPGMTRVTLDQLSPEEARSLLLSISSRTGFEVANRICELCGYLPLAIRTAGSLLSVTVDLEPVDYAARLENERTRLERLGKEGVDISVTASFNLSYSQLSRKSARVFRRLATFPGSFDSEAEVIICEDKEHKHLSELVRRGMVLYEREAQRYRLHELVRVFANTLLKDKERSRSDERFSDHYLSILKRANQLYLQSGVAHGQGLELFTREAENIRHGWNSANAQGESNDEVAKICWSYTFEGTNLLLNRMPADEIRVWSQRSLSIAKRLGNQEAELNPLCLLGLIDESIGEYDSAETYFRQCSNLALELGDNRTGAFLLDHLGRVQVRKGHVYEGIENYQRAQQILCTLGQHEEELKLVSDIALALSQLGEKHLAVDYLQKVLENARKNGNRLDEATALANLAIVWRSRSKTQCLCWSDEAAEIFQQLGYRHWQAQALLQSGSLRVETNESEVGIDQIKLALAMYREIGDGDGDGEARSVGTLGEAYRSLNRDDEALALFEEQLQIALKIGDRSRQITALGDMGVTLVKLGRYDAAILVFKEARQLAKFTGNHEDEFHSLCNLGRAYAASGKIDEAIEAFEEQIKLGKTMGLVSKQLHAIKHISEMFAGRGEYERAKEWLKAGVILSETSRDPHDWPGAIFELGKFLFSIGEHGEAIGQAKKAMTLFQRNNDLSCAFRVQQQIEDWSGGSWETHSEKEA
jgi:tetratricopeptide (TPR) repeat protein